MAIENTPPLTSAPAANRGSWTAGCYAAAAGVALIMALLPLLGLPCDRCGGGALSMVLPWIGILVYLALAALDAGRPQSAWLAPLVSLTVFIHADLMVESVLLRRLCWGCVATAALVFAAGGLRSSRRLAERGSLLLSLVLGVAGGFFSPFERVDYAVTRLVWPARLLAELPSVVSETDAFSPCAHASAVRMLLYEKDCGG